MTILILIHTYILHKHTIISYPLLILNHQKF